MKRFLFLLATLLSLATPLAAQPVTTPTRIAPITTTTVTATTGFKAGDGTAAAPSYAFASQPLLGMYRQTAGYIGFGVDGLNPALSFKLDDVSEIRMRSTMTLGWSSASPNQAGSDVSLSRGAAGVLEQKNGTNAQTFRVYRTFTDAANYERLDIGYDGTDGIFRVGNAGTGVARNLLFGTRSTGAIRFVSNDTARWQIVGSSGHLLAETDNTYDIGASGATRPRNLYLGGIAFTGTVQAAGTLQFKSGDANQWQMTAAGHLLANGDNALDIGASGATRPRDVYIAGTLTFGTTNPVALTQVGDGIARFVNSAGTGFTRLILGTNDASGIGIKKNGTSFSFVLGNDSSWASIAAGGFLNSGILTISPTAPTVTSAGTSPSIVTNGTAAFRVNVGTGGTATTIVLAMPAATTGWNCSANNITAAAANRANLHMVQQSSTTTAVTLQWQTVSTGAATAFVASDIVSATCTAY